MFLLILCALSRFSILNLERKKMQFQDKLFPDGTNAKTLKDRCKIDWQSCRMVFDTCTRAHPHSHHPLKRHNMLPCRIMPRMKRQHNISQWPDFDSLTHLTHLDHWQYSWQILCFKLHNTLHVHFTPNAYWKVMRCFWWFNTGTSQHQCWILHALYTWKLPCVARLVCAHQTLCSSYLQHAQWHWSQGLQPRGFGIRPPAVLTIWRVTPAGCRGGRTTHNFCHFPRMLG